MRKIDLAERAYKEVLDATKHQDDKVGRFLTAIAFLTTGAIALIATDNGLRRRFGVPGGDDHALLAWSTGLFFALTLAAVVLLLLCLSVPVRLPRSRVDPMRESHLFYSYIAARPRDEWVAYWETADSAELEASITSDYARESHNLAERVSAKYRHSHEASWLFVAALLFLGLSIYLKLLALFSTDSKDVVNLTTRHLVGIAVIASAHGALQVYTRTVHDTRSVEKLRDYTRFKHDHRNGAQRNAVMYMQRRWTYSLAVPATAYSLILACPVEKLHCGQLGATALIGLVTFAAMWLTRTVWDESDDVALKPTKFRVWRLPVLVTVVAVVTAWFAVELDGLLRVLAILLPTLWLCTANASRPFVSNRVARQLQRKRALQVNADGS